jgi:nitrogenase molybdenum-iron protein alpha/beta subunit
MNSSRTEGCTLTGALSVSTAISDGITIIHGPDGCTHHNFSLLHALWYEHDQIAFPGILSSALSETEIVFGGEKRLEQTLLDARSRKPGVICILTSCVAAAIGDDVQAVCDRIEDIPAMVIPTGGFLGGGFSKGVSEALLSLSGLGEEGTRNGKVNLIGEKNLEFEADANFEEIARLLALLGVGIQLRFVRNIPAASIARLGSASLNILRDPALADVGEALRMRFGTPFLSSFPVGFQGTLDFLEDVGERLDIDSSGAVSAEDTYQERLIASFGDLNGSEITVTSDPVAGHPALDELQELFDFVFTDHGTPLRFPDPAPVGTSGLTRMLHRWRRACRA